MRFTIFELLAWITFLAAMCGILFRGSHGEALFGVLWIVVTILTLKLFGRRCSLVTSTAVAAALGTYSAIATDVEPRKLPFALTLGLNCVFFSAVALIIWVIVVAADALITWVQQRFNRIVH